MTKFLYPFEPVFKKLTTRCLYDMTDRGWSGYYPIGVNNLWHGGVHLEANAPVTAIADGQIIAYKLSEKFTEDAKYGKYSKDFVLIKHEHTTPKGEKIKFYSLYVHLLPHGGYVPNKKKLKALDRPDLYIFYYKKEESNKPNLSEKEQEEEKEIQEWLDKHLNGKEENMSEIPPEGEDATTKMLREMKEQAEADRRDDVEWNRTSRYEREYVLAQIRAEGNTPKNKIPYLSVSKGVRVLNGKEIIEVNAGDAIGYTSEYCGEKNLCHIEVFMKDVDFLENKKNDESLKVYYVGVEFKEVAGEDKKQMCFYTKVDKKEEEEGEIITLPRGSVLKRLLPKEEKGDGPYKEARKIGFVLGVNEKLECIEKRGWIKLKDLNLENGERDYSYNEAGDKYILKSSKSINKSIKLYKNNPEASTFTRGGGGYFHDSVDTCFPEVAYEMVKDEKTGEEQAVKWLGFQMPVHEMSDEPLVTGWLREDWFTNKADPEADKREEDELNKDNNRATIRKKIFKSPHLKITQYYRWNDFFMNKRKGFDTNLIGYLESKAGEQRLYEGKEIIDRIESMQGAKRDGLIEGIEIKMAVLDDRVGPYLHRLVVRHPTEWSARADEDTGKFGLLAKMHGMTEEEIREEVMPHFKDMQWYDEVKAQLPDLPDPTELWYFHPVAFIEHMKKIIEHTLVIEEKLLPIEVGPERYARSGDVRVDNITKKPAVTKGIVIHYVGNTNSTAIANRNYWENLKNKEKIHASAHYIVGLEGEILRCIPEDEVAYHVGAKAYQHGIQDKIGKEPNNWLLGIECCHDRDDGHMTENTWNIVAGLTAVLMKKYKLNINNDLYLHYDITGKICHKWFVDNSGQWQRFKDVVQLQM